MSIPCLKLETPALNDLDRMIVEFFQLDAELRQRIYLHHFGLNVTTGKTLEPGKRMWHRIYRQNDWLRYQGVLNNFEQSSSRYRQLQQEQYQCRLRNEANIAKYGSQFEDIIHQLLSTATDPSISIFFPLVNDYFHRAPLVRASDCDYKKVHACPQCLMILDPRKFEPYYNVDSSCLCDCDSYFEFVWREWQPLETQSYGQDIQPIALPIFQI